MAEGRRSRWWSLPREGFTIDTIGAIFRSTALNPLITLPLFLLSRYAPRGIDIAETHPIAATRLRTLLALGVLWRLGRVLDAGVMNNWTNDTYDWKKEVVVVTGGSDGIGKEIVLLLAARGVKVAVIDIQELKYDCPPSVTFFKCDLSSLTSIESTGKQITSKLGAPTILINNAGIAGAASPILSTTPSQLQLTFSINTFSHFHLARAFVPHMVAQNHGMIVTVASAAGYASAPLMGDYAASKAAALAFHETLTAELATIHSASRVRTVVVNPGYVRTPLFRGFDEGDPFVSYPLHPQTVAARVVAAVFAARSAHVNLPGFTDYVTASVRGWPFWLQYALRKRLVKVMQGFGGRKVVQLSGEGVDAGKSEDAAGDEATQESGIIVSKEVAGESS